MTTRARRRDHVLATLDAAAAPVDAAHVAGALDVHVSTARFHLNKLIAAGLVEQIALPPTSVGRPRTGYAATAAKPRERLIELLVRTLGDDEQSRRRAALDIGRQWVAPIVADPGPVHPNQADPRLALPDPITVAETTLTALGFAVGSTASVFGEHELSICSCPLRDVTRADPAVARGIVEGALQQAIATIPALADHYTVAVTPDPAGSECTIMLTLSPARPNPHTRASGLTG